MLFDDFVIDLQPGDRLTVHIQRANVSHCLIDIATPKFEVTDDGELTDVVTPDAYHWMVVIDMFFKAQLQERMKLRGKSI
jgi:hypothetical protein